MSISETPPASSAGRALGRRHAVAIAAVAPVAALLGSPAAAGVRPERLRLRRDPGSPVAALDVALPSSQGRYRSPVMETTGFTMLGVTWRSGRGTVRVRVRDGAGGWGRWQVLRALHDGPDGTSAEGAHSPRATEPVYVGRSDAVQVELIGRHRDAELALIDTGRRNDDIEPPVEPMARPTLEPTSVDARQSSVPRPRVRRRRAWGADDSLLNGTPDRNRTIKQVHLHHTATGNSYTRREVPGIIRGIYRYHTQNLGWYDIGYNFLVDRFGRIWVGRRGSAHATRLVRGAHTRGFNHASIGVAVIGNFEDATSNRRIVGAVARIAAWRLAQFDRRPRARILMKSRGSSLYPKGEEVRLPVIDGHRDTNATACPGEHLYARLPNIRRRTKRRIDRLS
ncbi:N-acetylmuramoyl-L-alanine amidase [Nocardioides limicola]|uniref:N-acetylmuramoyl-L-alanine amidase n=1 Tax=Nocardioides limicola TaxID=2803368 RepID=UPI00193BA5A9|nr:N-acetylmuramoyl-L-alanine amidase [Nocardioides sp. DJM-14]